MCITDVWLNSGGVAGWAWSLVGSEQLLSHKLTTTASVESKSLPSAETNCGLPSLSLSLSLSVKQLLVGVAEKVLTVSEQQSIKPSLQRLVVYKIFKNLTPCTQGVGDGGAGVVPGSVLVLPESSCPLSLLPRLTQPRMDRNPRFRAGIRRHEVRVQPQGRAGSPTVCGHAHSPTEGVSGT